MSRAEIFRIIDVAPEPQPPRTSLELRAHRDREVEEGSRQPPALWANSSRQQGPMIELEHVMLPNRLDVRLIMLSEPTSDRARSYRLLRHKLLAHADPRIVAVTSASPGEGKTTCALNLALALAEDTMTRVLLLEANLRRPSLARLLEFDPKDSLVANITKFADVGPPYPVVCISGTRLHVAALPDQSFGDARLDRTLFAVALSDLRNAYDYIVIDSASVLESGDVDVVGECSSGVVLTARAGHSRRSRLQKAIRQLSPAPVLGSVLLDA